MDLIESSARLRRRLPCVGVAGLGPQPAGGVEGGSGANSTLLTTGVSSARKRRTNRRHCSIESYHPPRRNCRGSLVASAANRC